MQEETRKRLKRIGTAVFIIFFCFIAGGLTLIFEYPELADPILPVIAENRTTGDGGIPGVPRTPVIPPTTVPTSTPGPGPGPNPVTGTEIVLLLAGPPTLPVGSPYSVAALVTNATSGAAIPGRTVLLSVIAGPNTGLTLTGVTDASGFAYFTYTGTGGPGTDALSATITDPTGATRTSNTVTVTWTTGPVPPAESIRLIPGPASSPVSTPWSATALVNDTSSTPIAGRAVRFEVLSGPNAGLVLSGTTGAGGTAPFTYSGNGQTGTDRAVATMFDSGGVIRTSNIVSVTWTTGPGPSAESVTLFPGPATSPVGTLWPVRAFVNDTAGSPIAGRPVTLAVLSGPNAGTTVSGTTDAAGNVTFTYTSSLAGLDTLAATMTDSGGIIRTSNAVTVTWTILPPPGAESVRLIPGPASNLVGTPYSAIAHVNDTAGNPVAGRSVRLDITGANTLNTTGTTDAAGNVTFTYTSTVVGLDTLTATITDSGGIVRTSNSVTVTWTLVPPPPAGESIRLIAGPSPNPVNTPYSAIAHVNDTAGNPIAGRPVRLNITGTNTLSFTGTTDAAGNVTFTYTSTVVGTDTLGATMTDSGGILRASNNVTVAWTDELILLSPEYALLTPGDSHAVTVFVVKVDGTPVAGRSVTVGVRCALIHINTSTFQPEINDSVVYDTSDPLHPTFGNPDVAFALSGITNATGAVTFTYSSNDNRFDILRANMTDSGGLPRQSNTAMAVWYPSFCSETITLMPAYAWHAPGQEHTVTALLQDASGQPLAGRVVNLTLQGALIRLNATSGWIEINSSVEYETLPLSGLQQPRLTNPDVVTSFSGTTNATGMVSFTYSSAVPRVDIVTADRTGDGITIESGVVKVPAQPQNYALVYWMSYEALSISPPSASLTTGGQHTVTATLMDVSGMPLAGRSVNLRIEGLYLNDLNFTSIAPRLNATDLFNLKLDNPDVQVTFSGVTNATGQVSFTYTGTAPAFRFDLITADSMTSPTGWPVIILPAAAYWSPLETISLSPAAATLPVGTGHTLTAYVADAAGLPVAGRLVNITVDSGPHAGRFGIAVTNSTGYANVTFTGTAAGTDSISAVMTDASGTERTSNSVIVTWTTTPPPPGPETIVLSPATASLTVGDLHTVTATVAAAGGTPISGRQVNFTVLSGPNAGLNFTGSTDLAGNATFPFSAAAAGTDTVEATMTDADGALQTSNTVTATWTTGPPPPPVTELITLSPVSATLQAGSVHTVTAFVRASNGTPIEEREVTFEVLSGPNAGLVFGGDTDSYGYTEFPLSAAVAGTDTVRATMTDSGGVNRTSNTVSVTWITGPVPPSGETITLSPKSASPRVGGTIRMTALVLDGGTPVDERLVTFTVTSGPNAGKKFKAMTDSAGYATFPFSSRKTGTDTVIATMTDSAGSLKTSNEAKIRWRSGPSRPDRITLSPKHSSARVGGTITLTAHVYIRSGSDAGRKVVFSIISGPNAGRTYTATTDSNGYATFPYSSSKTGTDTVIATMTDSTGKKRTSNEAKIRWHTHPHPPLHDRISLSPLSADHAVGELHEFTALVTTRYGTPIGGRKVVFSITSGPNAGKKYTAKTDADGYATFPYTSSKTGTDTARASMTDSLGSLRTSNEAEVTWHAGPPPPVTERITLSPLSGSAAVGDSCNVTAYVFTSAGNPVAGRPVTFTVESGPHAGVTGSNVTDALGYASFSYPGTAVGTDTVVATMVNASGQQQQSNSVTVTWTILPPPVSETIQLIPGPASLQTGSTYTGHALVLDGNQNPVTGRLVHVSVTAGPNAGWFADGVTDGSGLFAFSYTGAGGPGTDAITASMTDSGGVARTSNTVSVLWTETPVPPQESIVLYPATAARNVGQQHTVTAMVLDAAGSPVFGREVRINVTAGPNAGDAVTGMTGASGTVAFTYTGDGGTGRDTLQAAMIGAGGTTVTSNTAIVDWSIPPTPVPEFPGIGIPVALLGLLAIVCRSMRRH